MKVLIVDDNADSLYMLDSLLKGNGYEVAVARNGKEALDHLEKHPAELIISDILMPKMDGFQLCRAVKANDALKNNPFVFYTATYTSEKDRDFALSLGASRFILKPTDPEEFIRIIKEVMEKSERGLIPPKEPSIEKETEYLKEHQARLLRKLEDKIAQLEESEERYRSLVACAADAIVTIDHAGLITSWNGAAETIFGYDAGEIIGKPVSLLAPDELRAEQDELILRLKERGFVGYLETNRKAKDGARIPVELSLSLMKDPNGKELGISGIIRDISARKKTEQFLQDVFQSMGEGLAVIGPDFRIRTANITYAKMAGVDKERIKGMTCHEATHNRPVPCDEEGSECPVRVSFTTGEPYSAVHRHEGKEGEPSDVEVRSYPLKDHSGAVVAAIEIVRDISSQKKLEAQLLQAQKMEAVGQLAGGVAHDFNNILSAIIGYGHIALMKMAKDDPHRMNIEHMLEAADRAAYLTKDLLLFSRKQVSERKAVDLSEIIRKVEKFLKRVIGEDVECKTMLQDRPVPVYADRHQLEQVLMNLATNARDAMPGGGAFTVMMEQAVLKKDFVAAHGYGRPGAYALVTVSDTGRGMDEETRNHIFEPFFTTKEVGKGTGLGMAVVYGIIKQHDGFVNVYSEPGKGTTFRIYLPIIAREAVEETVALREEVPARGTETVLLAEDDESLRRLSRTVLTEYGYKVIEAMNGEDAVKQYKENKDRIQLLLFDLIMPKMNGKEAYDEIRKIKPGMKIIFASGYAPDIVRQKVSLEKGAHLVYKPISPMALLRKVRSVLDGTEK